MSLDCVFQLSPTEVRLLPSQREEGTEALSSGVIIFQRDDSQVSVQNASVFRRFTSQKGRERMYNHKFSKVKVLREVGAYIQEKAV